MCHFAAVANHTQVTSASTISDPTTATNTAVGTTSTSSTAIPSTLTATSTAGQGNISI